ncbi:MAG: phosphate acyltransferase PlsX [Ruminococcaceae bacterium]|nr:phosphate acyltransferase PlsX [Oscillospiraceae bacterium]
MNTYKIAIDVMGSDNGPELLVKGALAALSEHEDLEVLLFGDADTIDRAIGEYDRSRIEVVSTTEVIDNYDNPMEAIYKKTDSSLVRALMTLRERDDVVGVINASSTGALLAGSLRYVPAKQLRRPALASILPAENGGFTCLVDTGANIDCSAQHLVDFAHMGSDFMKQYYGIENPKIGLLSNGTEPTKGNKLVKETHALLKKESDLNFIGNIEGNRALSGDCDVLVAEGFAGNQVFKNSEGIARRLITDIVKYAKKTGSSEIMQLVGYLMKIYDFNSLGGAIVLGVDKPVIKVRGSANADTIKNTTSMLMNMIKHNDLFNGKDVR